MTPVPETATTNKVAKEISPPPLLFSPLDYYHSYYFIMCMAGSNAFLRRYFNSNEMFTKSSDQNYVLHVIYSSLSLSLFKKILLDHYWLYFNLSSSVFSKIPFSVIALTGNYR